MLHAYTVGHDRLIETRIEEGQELPPGIIWVDLVQPVPGEDKIVEHLVGVQVPTREEAEEIEPSSRLYVENGARYMIGSLIYGVDLIDQPKLTVVTFIMTEKVLVTIRYEDLRPFIAFAAHVTRPCEVPADAQSVFVGLLEAAIDRNADLLERAGSEIDIMSGNIFATSIRNSRKGRYQDVMRRLGKKGDLVSKIRESLMTLGRMLHFYATERLGMPLGEDLRAELRSMNNDVRSLEDHANFLANKITFLLDAIVGLVSIEQNEIIKLFSVVSVVFLPPTLVASIYGMNFDFMPELHWNLGYPFAIVMMVCSAIVPYLFFKWQRWL